ncbi:hypothetical protein [Cellulomonas xylanilytica]|uniref:Uncharacterized protein n=1 Tax=Cellulomonas xylanilytica TaxID=233583 RepID=A0A510UZV2_9CELL|nr:hypothetical protein [Cellulomonas xylanilytica]GEK20187.1 hypothetical protein CXY01_07070 [Cellulomonas xylanilytica]
MSQPSGDRLAQMTRTLVVRAAALAGRARPDELAAVLYRSGGSAPDPRQDPRWPHHLAHLAERSAPGTERYERSRAEHWNGWTTPGVETTAQVHKVYVSPTVPGLATVLPVVFATAAALDVPSWKVGADAAGLHRADKIVLYLPSASRADTVAAALADLLDGCSAQGVPFTGQVGATGIVSRGQDRPGESWRAVVCRAVADALDEHRARLGPAAAAEAVAGAALDALADAYDVVTWRPGTREQVPA